MDDLLRMAGCFGVVAAFAVPVALLGCNEARATGTPLLPRPAGWRLPWTGFEVVVAFVVVSAVLPAIAIVVVGGAGLGPPVDWESEDRAGAPAVRAVWAGVLVFPVQLALLAVATRRRTPGIRVVAARLALGVFAWAALTPAVLLVHAGVGWLFAALGWAAEEHPLAKLGADARPLEQVLLVMQAAVAAPVVEELLFRGVLLGWLVGGRAAFGPTDRAAADRRAWWPLGIGLLFVAATARGEGGPVLFAAGLLAGWGVLRLFVRRKRRAVGAVYASAALFAEVHSAVWPSPVPLFVLGLGLGWLAVRTRGVLAPAVVHGLFNLVSVLFVLRGPG